jgi:threonine dehydratase
MDTLEQIDGLRVPDLADIDAARTELRPFLRTTPIFERDDLPELPGTRFQFKFELLQVSGTFKARGAFSSLLALDASARAAGVTAISSGNHAVAVAYAAMRLGISAKVVTFRTANPARLALARRYGAEVILADDGATGFAMVREIEREEGRFFVHPFNSYRTILGTATLGAEWSEQARDAAGGKLAAIMHQGAGPAVR